MNSSKVLKNSFLAGIIGLAAIALPSNQAENFSYDPKKPDKNIHLNLNQAEFAPSFLAREQIDDAKSLSFLSDKPLEDKLDQSLVSKNPNPKQPLNPVTEKEVKVKEEQTEKKQSQYVSKPIVRQKPIAEQLETYESHQIHRLVSKLTLPEFPIATACVQRGKNIFHKGYIGDAQYAEFQPEAGLGLIDSKKELEILAKGIAAAYNPSNVDSRAFERLAETAGVDKNLVTLIEKTEKPTVYDALAQFSSLYSQSLERCRFPGLVVYHDKEQHLHVTGNVKAVKEIK